MYLFVTGARCFLRIFLANKKGMRKKDLQFMAAILRSKSREIEPDSCSINPDFDCTYTFLIDLTPSRIPFDAKSIKKL